MAEGEVVVAEGGYVNGSDMLLYINGKAIGHCSSHTTTFNAETKERAVKPVASFAQTAGQIKFGVAREFQNIKFSAVVK